MLPVHNTYHQAFEAHNVCVLVPTYNNAGTLEAVLLSVLEYTNRIIVVNDGSTDGTAAILAKYPQADKITHEKNKGKGKALRSGFKRAIELGYAYAITIDTDGQHFAKDLPLFLEKLETEPRAIIIGARNLHMENMPGKNTFANKFSNFWFRVETGINAPDTQSGYRLYPLHAMKNMRFFGTKYEFEVEVLVRSAWKGIKISWIPVAVYYPPPEERISHFHPGRDFSRISVLNTILVLVAFLYIKPRDFFIYISRAESWKAMLLNKDEPNIKKAASIGVGIFMGIVPLWGFQMAVALALAALFRLNKALTLIASNISIPPMIPLIIYLSFLCGRIWIAGDTVNLLFSRNITINDIKLNVMQYVAGSITLAVIAGMSAFLTTYILLQTSKRLKEAGK